MLVVLGFVFAEPLVRVLAPGFEAVPGKPETTVLLTRVMLPFLPLVSFAAVAMGMLNAHERFGMPALAPASSTWSRSSGAAVLWALGFAPAQVALGWAVGTLLGGAAQFLVQVPALLARRAGGRGPEWAPGRPGAARDARLMAPATVGPGRRAGQHLREHAASPRTSTGAVAWLQYAFRILYLPIGIFGVAVGTVATTGLARRAAAGDMDGHAERSAARCDARRS